MHKNIEIQLVLSNVITHFEEISNFLLNCIINYLKNYYEMNAFSYYMNELILEDVRRADRPREHVIFFNFHHYYF